MMAFNPSMRTVEFFHTLCESGVKQSAERVWSACETLIGPAGDSRLVNVASVGRTCTKMFGGPKAQSIRNQPNTLKVLVEMIVSDHPCGKSEETRMPSTTHMDPHLLLEQITHLQEANNRLHMLIKTLGPFQIVPGNDGLPMLVPPEDGVNSNGPTSSEADAILRLLSRPFHEQLGLTLDSAGNLRFGNRVLIEFPALQFLRRAVKHV